MQLSASSSIIIDLLLLSDAAEVKDKAEIRRLAKCLERTALRGGCPSIAMHARAVDMLAADDAACSDLAGAVSRLLAQSEREIHSSSMGENDAAPFRIRSGKS